MGAEGGTTMNDPAPARPASQLFAGVIAGANSPRRTYDGGNDK